MAHITLIRPPQVMPSDVLTVSQGVPSIGVAYLAAALKHSGHEVTIIDALAEGLDRFRELKNTRLQVNGISAEEIAAKIPSYTDIIGISAMFSNEWIYTKFVIKTVYSSFPNIPIIAGGEHITADPEYSLNSVPEITAAARGEGEEVIVDLVNTIISQGELSNVPGINYIDDEGKHHSTPDRMRIKAVDDVSWPAWDLYPIEKYLDAGFGFNVLRGRPMPMMASRGCPYQCTFCSNPLMWTTKWLAREPKDVIKEMKYYIEKYNIDHVEFYDLTTIVKKSWIVEFTKELIKENIQINWSLPSGTRSEALDQEVLYLLKETGCKKLTYAPESGSAKTLKRIKKVVKIPRMLKSIRFCVKAGISVKSNIIFGFPGQTLIEVLETYVFMMKAAFVGMNDVSVFSFVPYPGSQLFFELVELFCKP